MLIAVPLLPPVIYPCLSPHLHTLTPLYSRGEVYHIHVLKINNIPQVRRHIKHCVSHIHLAVETMFSVSYMALSKGNQASYIFVTGDNFGNYSDTNPS